MQCEHISFLYCLWHRQYKFCEYTDVEIHRTLKHYVKMHDCKKGMPESLVNPSAKPSPSTRQGLLLHMGQSMLRSCEALIQTMRFQRWPEEMGRAPCMCWPLWRRPSVTLCSTSEHSVSLRDTCRGQQTTFNISHRP